MPHVITTRGGARRCYDRRVRIEERAKSRARLVILDGRSRPEFVRNLRRSHESMTGTFSDGAIEVKLEENVRGRDLFNVQSGHANPNNHLMEVLFLLNAARRTHQGQQHPHQPHQGDETT